MKKENWYKLCFALARPLGWILFPQRTVGRENIPEGPAIFCANHSDAIDPALISFGLGIGTYTIHLAKAELQKVPLLGQLMEKIGSIFIRRGEQDVNAIKSCMRALKEGNKIILFPEGTRVHGDKVVEPKTGAVHMASRLHVPIVPVYLPRDKKIFRPFRLMIGKPYYVEPQTHGDYNTLAQELMERIWALRG